MCFGSCCSLIPEKRRRVVESENENTSIEKTISQCTDSHDEEVPRNYESLLTYWETVSANFEKEDVISRPKQAQHELAKENTMVSCTSPRAPLGDIRNILQDFKVKLAESYSRLKECKEGLEELPTILEDVQLMLKKVKMKSLQLKNNSADPELLHETASSDSCVPSSYRTSVCPSVAGASGHLAKKRILDCKLGKCGSNSTTTYDMQKCCSPHFHLDQLEPDERDGLLEEENRKQKHDKCCMLVQVLSNIDFEAIAEVPKEIYSKVNDIKTCSACPCLCLAVQLNKLLVDLGYPPWFDSTLTIRLISIITKMEESLLRQRFCSPETEEGADAFGDLLYQGIIEEVGDPLRFDGAVQLKFLNDALKIVAIDKTPGQGKEKEGRWYILGLGYENSLAGHCINFFVKNNKLVLVDPQNGGQCQSCMFEGINDIRVFKITKQFENNFSSCLRQKKLSKSGLVDMFENLTYRNFTREDFGKWSQTVN